MVIWWYGDSNEYVIGKPVISLEVPVFRIVLELSLHGVSAELVLS